MKKLLLILLFCGLTIPVFASSEPSEADMKWVKAVSQKIAAGKTTISTPSEVRAKLAVNLAKQNGRTAQIQRRNTSYVIVVN
ncbi:MAG: hypothetical protein JXQ71_04810 [Verrucomicrobia bacterium]|nr:hypothetical protein [Verrucomicrobiota bacterium]